MASAILGKILPVYVAVLSPSCTRKCVSSNSSGTCFKRLHFLQVLLHRSSTPEATYHSVNVAYFNQDLFLLCWSHTVAALSYVFENAEEKAIVQKAINGFRLVLFKILNTHTQYSSIVVLLYYKISLMYTYMYTLWQGIAPLHGCANLEILVSFSLCVGLLLLNMLYIMSAQVHYKIVVYLSTANLQISCVFIFPFSACVHLLLLTMS